MRDPKDLDLIWHYAPRETKTMVGFSRRIIITRQGQPTPVPLHQLTNAEFTLLLGNANALLARKRRRFRA
jgi:hypothetical protein